MADAGVIAAIVVAVIVVIGLWILSKTVYIVHQAEGMVVERFGRFNRVLSPGWNIVLPLIESPRVFSWRKTYVNINGKIVDENINLTRIDLRESVFNFVPYEVYTKDTVRVKVNCVMYYSIADVRKAIYEVDDLTTAVSNTAQTQLKEVFGAMTFSEALVSKDYINNHMKRNFGSTFEGWGLTVERIELQDMTPLGATSDAMKKQMVAERNRRAEFITAEGTKAAMRLQSEGSKLKSINLGVAEQEATRKRSEGRATAQVEVARAEKASLDAVADAISADHCSQTEFMLAQRFNELFRTIVNVNEGSCRKKIYLPYEARSIAGLIKHLPSVYGRNAPRAVPAGTGAMVRAGGAGGGGKEAFDDLS